MATKRTTAADVAAAVRLGTMAADAEVSLGNGDDNASPIAAAMASGGPVIADRPLSVTDHDCAIPGCRHGAAHGPSQPDRQVKMACPNCGAVARLTLAALGKCGGMVCVSDGGTFAPAARRVYSRKAQ